MSRSFMAVLVVGIWVGCLVPEPARAAIVFTVDSTADDADAAIGDLACATAAHRCTLRAALEEADKQAGTVSILLPAGTYRVNRQLAYNYWLDPDGSAADWSDGSVELIGAGQAQTVIDGQDQTRVFYLRTRSGRVTMRDLSITRGRDLRPHDPLDQDRPGFGAGIFVDGLLDLERVTITQNRAQEGGGLYVDFGKEPTASVPNPIHPIVNLRDVTVTANQAVTTRFGFGGGGIANGAELFADGLDVSGNFAESQGGGLYNNSWYWVELHDFNVSDNVGRRDAGGIQVDLGKARLFDGTVARNRTQCCRTNGSIPGGAGIFNYGLNEGGRIEPAVMELTRVVVADNVAEGTGGVAGGIYNWGHMTLREVSVVGNRASYGAGIYSGDPIYTGTSIVMHNTTISGNTGKASEGAPRQLDSEGGGAMVRNGSVVAYNSTITQNDATLVGGISNHNGATFTLYNTILAQNLGDWSTDCWGQLVSGDHNVVGDTVGNTHFPCSLVAEAHDHTGVDARLGALTGVLPSHLPNADSPAIDRANPNFCPVVDVAGMARPQGGGCDVGAREYVSPARPVATGQKKCWDANGAVIDCAGSGQDGALREGLRRRYADDGNGTIRDVRTGLAWEALDDAGGVHDKDRVHTWADAFTKIAVLNAPPCFAGHCDWRLPNVNELQSLVDYGRRRPPAVSVAFAGTCVAGCATGSCSCVAPVGYWSASSHPGRPSNAWTVDFGDGRLQWASKSGTAAVRAVRGGA